MILGAMCPMVLGAASAASGAADTPIEIAVTPSRTTGVAPLGVFFDATATTSPETSLPFHELYALWDFDDSGSGTFSYGNPTLNSRNAARGLVAAHLYTAAGTYTPILTVFDGVNIEQYAEDTITVTSQDAAYPTTSTIVVSTSGTFTGKPTGATEVTESDLGTVLGTHLANDTRILFRGGETFSESTSFVITESRWRIGSFGTGRAIFSSTIAGELLQLDDAVADGAISGIEFTGNDTATSVFIGMLSDTLDQADQITIHDVDAHNCAALVLVASNDGDCAEWFIHDCACDTVVGATNQIRFDGTKFSIQGCDINGEGTNESVVRIGFSEKAVISHNRVQENVQGWELFAFRSPSVLVSQYVIFSDNELVTGTATNPTLQIGPSDNSKDSDFQDFVIERNFLRCGTGGGNGMIDMLSLTRGTIRNNLYDATNENHSAVIFHFFRAIGVNVCGGNTDVHIYNNTAYFDSAEDPARFVGFGAVAGDAVDTHIYNNIIYAPNAGTTTYELTSGSSTDTLTGTNTVTTGSGFDASPSFATSDGAGGGTLTVPNDFKILTGSYAEDTGTDGLKVFEDYFGNIRDWETPNTDMGFHAFSTGTLPSV